eukprot:m.238990 g.238990  ORF g.238990 m.238990 type:complete len:161 (-) comp54363_c2_seq27:341-823(-)
MSRCWTFSTRLARRSTARCASSTCAMLMALFLSSPSLIARGTLPSFLPSFFSHLNPAPALLSRSPVIFSFDEVESFQKLALRVKDKSKFPMVVVGNKSDLVSERVISTTEASALAEKIGCPYIETSAKEARNIEEVFFEMVRVIRLGHCNFSCREILCSM